MPFGPYPRLTPFATARFARQTPHCELFRSDARSGASQSRHSPGAQRSSR